MPYHMESADGGWFVVGPEGRKSKTPLSHERAMAQMRALYANVPEARPARTPVKPLQIQNRKKNDNDADDKIPARARGGKVNLSGKQKTAKSKKAAPPIPAGPAAVPPVGPMAAPPMMGAGGPPLPPIGPNGIPGAKKGGKFFIKAAVGDNKGVFKAKAKAAGKTTAEYASEKSGAPGKLGAEARLAETLMHLRNRK